MKKVYFENTFNREQFYCTDVKDVRTIDGHQYLRVFRINTQHDCLIKKDLLRRIAEPKALPR